MKNMLLIGVGGAGATVAHSVSRAFGDEMRLLALDTDAATSSLFNGPDCNFRLLGGNRLSGRGSGGNAGEARVAFLDAPEIIDADLKDVRLAIIVAAAGGGTGGGATPEVLKYLHKAGVATVFFAVLPFKAEGDERVKQARAAVALARQYADVSISIPLDDIVKEAAAQELSAVMTRAGEVLASGISFFWRILNKPGYIRFDAERLRTVLTRAGTARFAVATVSGEDRVAQALALFKAHPLLIEEPRPIVSRMIVGVLAGDDLRVCELAALTDGLAQAFGTEKTIVDLGTVQDEATFSGRLSVVVFLFETNDARKVISSSTRAFAPAELFGVEGHTMLNGEDMDIPAYIRQGLSLNC